MARSARQHIVLLQEEGGHARARLLYKEKKKKKKFMSLSGSIRLEPGMKVREEKNCKKSPFAFVVETPVIVVVWSCFAGSNLLQGRQYMMYPANKSSQENSAWEKAINNVLSPSSSSKPASSVPQVQSLQKVNSGGSNNNNARQEDKFRYEKGSVCCVCLTEISAGARAERDDSLVGRLMFSKGISSFLQAQDTQMCEFWNLW